MTLPPCKPDGINCPRRYIGCKSECEKWHEWLVIHAKETEALKTDLNKDWEYMDYMDKNPKLRKRRGQR